MNLEGLDLAQLFKGSNAIITLLVGVIGYLFYQRKKQSDSKPVVVQSYGDSKSGEDEDDDPFAPLPGRKGHPILNMIFKLLKKFIFEEKSAESRSVESKRLDDISDNVAMAMLASLISKDQEKAKKFKDLLT